MASCFEGSIDWSEIEERVRPHVKFLRDAGWKTTGSCGHDMWVMIDCPPSDLPALERTLHDGYYRDFELSYTIHEGFGRWRAARVKFGGKLAGDRKPFDLVLLEVDPESHPLYFVIEARRFPFQETDVERDHHDRYHYDEGTCPTNWTDGIVCVVSRGDEDPHGFATFVARREPPVDYQSGAADYGTIFPEIDKGLACTQA